jgi:hypothetical protein
MGDGKRDKTAQKKKKKKEQKCEREKRYELNLKT